MNAWKTLVVGSALLLAAPWALAAQPASDSAAGTWKLDLAKSTFGSGSPPKSEMRTYTVTPRGTHVVIETEDAKGQKSKNETLLTYDGKPQVLKGNPDYDTVTTTRIDANETHADMIRQGKIIGSLRRLVSPDGQTMTINVKTNRADGTTETAMSVYERQ
jgi:hypothetical protein